MGPFGGSILDKIEGFSSNCTFAETQVLHQMASDCLSRPQTASGGLRWPQVASDGLRWPQMALDFKLTKVSRKNCYGPLLGKFLS